MRMRAMIVMRARRHAAIGHGMGGPGGRVMCVARRVVAFTFGRR